MPDFSYVKQAGITAAKPYAERKKTNLIIDHHSSTKMPMTDEEAIELIRSIHAAHIRKGNRGIDYNFLVAGNGSVFDGRGLKYEGGHVLNGGKSTGMNARSVGICALGDFEHNQMPEAMKDGLKRINRDVAQQYGITEIIKHKDVKDTDCPGQYFPFDEIKEYALGQDAPQPVPEQPEEDGQNIPALSRNLKLASPLMRGDDVRQAQERLEHHLAQPGKIDGAYGSKTKAAVIRFQKARISEGYDLGTAGADGVIGPKTWKLLW